MKLTIKERLLISKLYPQKGNMIEQTLVEDIIKKVKISQEEIAKIKLRLQSSKDGNSYRWDEKEAKDLDVNFTKAELNLLKERVKELDTTKQITQDLLSVCKKIQE